MLRFFFFSILILLTSAFIIYPLCTYIYRSVEHVLGGLQSTHRINVRSACVLRKFAAFRSMLTDLHVFDRNVTGHETRDLFSKCFNSRRVETETLFQHTKTLLQTELYKNLLNSIISDSREKYNV